MQNENLNQEEQSFDSLPPYEQYQLTRYGNVLNNFNPADEEGSEFERLSTAEINYIFNNENCAQ